MKTYSYLDEIQKSARIEKSVFTRVLKKTRVTEDDIIISQTGEGDIEEFERIFEDQISGTEMGSLFATYLNVPLKALYEGLARNHDIAPRIPPYFYSCPAIDDMLLGHHPKTYYFDISRGGPVSVVRRSLGYLKLAQEKHAKSNNPQMMKWIKEFGIGTCIPVITFDNLVSYATENNAKMYAIPATSVAESLTACAVYFTGMRGDIRRITMRDDWMNSSGQSRNKGSLKIYEALHKYIIETRGYNFFKNLVANGSNLDEIAQLYMEMADRVFCLGSQREQMCNTFAEIMFDPQSKRSHPNYGAQADCSELVVRSRHLLSPIPWELVFLLGDTYGTSLDQLIAFGKLIKKSAPETVIIIPCDDSDKPLLPNDVETMIPNISDYVVTAWSSYILGKKINRQKSQLMMQQSATR
jgi:hypothetical protein